MGKSATPIAVIALLAAIDLHAAEFTDITGSPDPVGLYQKFEISFGVSAAYSNPYDSAEVNIQAVFTAPSGAEHAVPAFWFQDYTRFASGGEEKFAPKGEPGWRVRHAPVETGIHTFVLELTDKNGTVRSDPGSFTVTPSGRKGFIRVHADDRRYLEFDDGSFYFPMGQNVGWASSLGTYDYDLWMTRMGEAGENWMRIWCTHFGKGQSLEWNRSYWSGWYHGIGRYSEEGAWKWDYLVNKAEALGIAIQMVIQHHGQFSKNTNSNWDENPYNVANGGFLNSGDEFFSNNRAKKFFRQKMRYTIARWGYSTSILAWELFNEVMWTDDYDANYPVVAEWHREMASYIHAVDPWSHIVTTSARDADSLIWSAPGMDINQIHYYGPGVIDALRSRQSMMRKYDKPNIIGEFGDDWQGGGEDPAGTVVHQGLWATAILGGGAMPWWWDSYIHPKNLYFHWRALADFWRGEDLRTGDFESVPVSCAGGPASPSGVRIYPGKTWESSTKKEFWVQPDGSTPGIEGLAQYIQGSDKAAMGREALFHLDFKAQVAFGVYIGDVSAWNPGILQIFLDGATTPAVNQTPRKQTLVTVDVPGGPHTVRVYNAGSDWFRVDYFAISGLGIPAARAFGFSDGKTAYVWIQDRDQKQGGSPNGTLSGVRVSLTGMEPGAFRATLWNTWTGTSALLGIFQGSDTLNIGPFDVDGDAALKIKFTGGGTRPPVSVRIVSNYPNPFRGETWVEYEIPERGNVRFVIFDVRGRNARVMEGGVQDAGIHAIKLDSVGLPSGVYFLRVESNGRSAALKIAVLK